MELAPIPLPQSEVRSILGDIARRLEDGSLVRADLEVGSFAVDQGESGEGRVSCRAVWEWALLGGGTQTKRIGRGHG